MNRDTRRPRGFTLLEALISLSVLSLGLLGMLQLQIFGLASDAAARSRTEVAKVGEELVHALERLPLTDPALAPDITGDAAPATFGPLLRGGSVMGGSYHTWSDGAPVPGARTAAQLATGAGAPLGIERRWTVWEYVPTGGTPGVVRLISVSVVYHERGKAVPSEVVFYTQRHNPAPLLFDALL